MNTNRIYGHQELAQLYFPHVLPDSASTQLTRWIERNEQLKEALAGAGRRKGLRLYTPRQVSILVAHLGEPDEADG